MGDLQKPELLAPAGSLDKLVAAIDFGADAVYIGGEEYSLRTASQNFTSEDMKAGIDYAHKYGKKVYVACNIIAHNSDMELFGEYIRQVEKAGADAVIVADLGMLSVVRRICPRMAVHMSTQANITNYQTCEALYGLGVKRVVLARELSLGEICEIRKNTSGGLQIECFIHGSMCMSHSGRCLLSNYLTGRDANRGNCSHPCRWNYALVEEKRPGQFMPVTETERGTFIFNSKDLCMIAYIPDLLACGMTSFKIEGRVKSDYYVAAVVSAYRRAIDLCFEDIGEYMASRQQLVDEVSKVSHREYYTGFYFEDAAEQSQVYGTSSYMREYEVVARVKSYNENIKVAKVVQKNRFFAGERLEVLPPSGSPFDILVTEMADEQGNGIYSAPHPEMVVVFPCEKKLPPGSFLRKRAK